MNRSYKSVFNRKTGVCQVVSERTRNAGKSARSVNQALLAIVLGLSTAAASAQMNLIDNGDILTVTPASPSPLDPAAVSHIGFSSAGTLNIESGGIVANTYATIGSTMTGVGTVKVSGAGSAWHNANTLVVGSRGKATLNIENGGSVSSLNGVISENLTGVGTVKVSGAGSTWHNANTLTVGQAGKATLSIENGASVSSFRGEIGSGITTDSSGKIPSNGSVTVTGNGANWANTDSLIIGGYGDAQLSIRAGGKVTNTIGYIGGSSDSVGTATVNGAGSSWENSDNLYVGYQGTGTLNIEAGARVTNSTASIGERVGSSGTVVVTGAGSVWHNAGTLAVGQAGKATLSIENGASVSSFRGEIGSGITTDSSGKIPSNGSVTVTGNGANWANTDSLIIGGYGDAQLSIRAGGKVTNTIGYIGGSSDSVGTATVNGAGSSWENSGNLFVGSFGKGSLHIEAGARVTNNNASIGDNLGSSGTVIVTGAGSVWENATSLLIGHGGTGTFTIEDGGKVISQFVSISGFSSGVGTATVTGAGSIWQNSSAIFVTQNGTGTLNIENGGLVSSAVIILSTTGNGILNLNGTNSARGTLSTNYLTANGAGISAFNWNGGILRAAAAQSNFLVGLAVGDIRIGAQGAFFDTQIYNVGINNTAGILAGSGGLTKLGSGILSIAGANTYAGDTTIAGGTLQFDSYNQSSHQTLTVGAAGTNAGEYGQLNVTGTATFSPDAHINVDVATINTLAPNLTLGGVITAGTLNASSFNVTDNSALFNFRALINNNRVDLLTSVNSSTGIQAAIRGNGAWSGLGAAQVLDGLVNGGATGDMNNVVNALGRLSNNRDVSRAAMQTLPLISGTQALQATLGTFQNVIRNRNGGGTGLSSGDALTNKQVWTRGFGSRAEQDDRSGISGFSADSWGLAFGADADVSPDARFGLAYAYAKTSLGGNTDLSGTAQRANIDSHVVSAYGSKDIGHDRSVAWQADIGMSNNANTRQLSFGGLHRTATADYHSYSAHVGASIAQQIALSEKTTLTPAMRADYTWIRSQAYSETGANALNLQVASNTTDALLLGAEANLRHRFSPASRIDVNVGIAYDTINKSGNIAATYAGAPGQAFATAGIDHSPWLIRGGIGYTHTTLNGTEINLRYGAEGRTGYLNQTASIRMNWAF